MEQDIKRKKDFFEPYSADLKMDFDDLVEKINNNFTNTLNDSQQEVVQITSNDNSSYNIEPNLDEREYLSAKLRTVQLNRLNKSLRKEKNAKSNSTPKKTVKVSKFPDIVQFPKEKLSPGLASLLENKSELLSSDLLQIAKIMADQMISIGE